MSGSDLEDREEGAVLDNTADDFSPEEQDAFGALAENDRIPFRKEAKKKVKGLLSNKFSKILLFGGGGASIMFAGLIVAIMLLFGSLKIVNLAEHITVWNLARSARTWRQSIARVTEEQIATEVMKESTYDKLKARFGETKTAAAIEKVNSYRPAKLLEKMNANSKPVYKEVGERKFLGFLGPRKEFVGWDFNGVVIEKNNPRFFHPIANYSDKIRISAEAQALFEKKYPNANTLVRNKAVRDFLKQRGIKLWGFQQKGKEFKNKTRQAAAVHEQATAWEERKTPPGPCKVDSTCKSTTEVRQTIDDELDKIAKDPDKSGGAAAIGDKTSDVAGEAIKKGSGGTLEGILSKTSLIYTIALPVCLIYEGSLTNSGSTIDSSETALQKAFFDVTSTAGQQKAGHVTAESMGAKDDKYGLISQSIPERRARGETIDTIDATNPAALPQSSSTGTYSLFDAYLGGNEGMSQDVIDFIESIVDEVCPRITTLEAGLAVTAIELALQAMSFGAGSAVTGTAKTGVKALLEKATAKLATKTIGKGAAEVIVGRGLRYIPGNLLKIGGKFTLKTGVYAGGTIGLTELAKLSVLKHSNIENSGLATDELAAEQADMGGNLYNNDELMRKFSYGVPLAGEDVVQDKAYNMAYLTELNSQKTTFDRYFAISNPDSLFSKVGMNIYASISQPNFLSHIISSLFASISKVGSVMNVFTSQKVAAATTTGAGEYNIVQWGWTAAENNLIDNDEEFAPIVNQLVLENSGNVKAIEDKYNECFTSTMGTLLSKGKIARNDDGSIKPDDGLCAPNKLGLANNEFGDKMIFRWRLAKRYDNALNHLKSIQNPDTSSSSDSNSGSEIIAGDTSDLTCSAGNDAGVGRGYQDGNLILIRLCNVQGAIVNAQIASQIDKMLTAARSEGEPLSTGGGFRTMESQIALRIEHGCPDPSTRSSECSPPTARPGHSNHQMGLAIDFANCKTQATSCWKWLSQNASKYGFKNFDDEPWHWSVDGN